MTNEEAALFIEAHQADPVWREARSDGMLHALDLAVIALCSPGAGAMREAAAKVLDEMALAQDRYAGEKEIDGLVASAASHDVLACYYRNAAKKIRALPLPAPEVPEAVKVWAARHDKWVEARETMNVIEYNLRDWIRKEYGI